MSLIDRYLPHYQFVERHALRVRATPAALLDRAADPAVHEDPFIARCIALREAPARLLARCGMQARLPQRPFGLADFTVLGRSEGEIAFGLAGRFWRADYGLVRFDDPQAFERASSPQFDGAARLVLNFTARPQQDGSTLLSTETRVHCPDAATRLRFTPYWLLIRPVSGLIRRRILRRLEAAAGAAAKA